MRENEFGFNPEETEDTIDLTNEDHLQELLASAIPEALQKIADFHKISREKVELLSHFAILRKEIQEQSKKQLEERTKNNPTPTSEERDMGCYIENIEPHVRTAVTTLRHKGYSTYESGFWSFSSQKIGFTGEPLNGYKLPDEIQKELEEQEIEVVIKPNSVSFTPNKPLTREEITNVWNQLASVLPDLHTPAKPSDVVNAQNFREKH
jgi:hypothetical protein